LLEKQVHVLCCRRVLEVNVVGVLATCQAFLPLLRAGQHKGRIVNLGSVVRLRG
jgi:NAD(P)-dependent dehydrogenase (short-subunit alcohol dehydrogenase family)